MKVTAIRFFEAKAGTKIKANVSLTLDGALAVNDVAIVEGNNGFFVSYPQRSYKNKDGETVYRDIVFPVSKTASKALSSIILKKYEEWKNENGEENEEIPFRD